MPAQRNSPLLLSPTRLSNRSGRYHLCDLDFSYLLNPLREAPTGFPQPRHKRRGEVAEALLGEDSSEFNGVSH